MYDSAIKFDYFLLKEFCNETGENMPCDLMDSLYGSMRDDSAYYELWQYIDDYIKWLENKVKEEK